VAAGVECDEPASVPKDRVAKLVMPDRRTFDDPVREHDGLAVRLASHGYGNVRAVERDDIEAFAGRQADHLALGRARYEPAGQHLLDDGAHDGASRDGSETECEPCLFHRTVSAPFISPS
jgi:hypothetical protein